MTGYIVVTCIVAFSLVILIAVLYNKKHRPSDIPMDKPDPVPTEFAAQSEKVDLRKNITFRPSPELEDRIRYESETTGRTMNAIISEGMDLYFVIKDSLASDR